MDLFSCQPIILIFTIPSTCYVPFCLFLVAPCRKSSCGVWTENAMCGPPAMRWGLDGTTPVAAEHLQLRGHCRLLVPFFPCNAHRAYIKMSKSKGGTVPRCPTRSAAYESRSRQIRGPHLFPSFQKSGKEAVNIAPRDAT